MKIGFCGAHGTGKSTLANLLKKDFIIKESVARDLNKFLPNFNINEDADSFSQSAILAGNIYNVLEDKNLIATRTTIDAMAYTFASKNISNKDKLKLEQIYMPEGMSMFDFVFYLPIEFETEDDGLRSLDKEYRKEVDDFIKYFLKKYNIKYITLTGSIDKRMKKIHDVIGV